MSIYVSTTISSKDNKSGVICVFEDLVQLESWANAVNPDKVSYSIHPSLKKAKAFAKKLQKQTPWMEVLYESSKNP